MGLSELVAPRLPDPREHLYLHVVTHSIWHLGVFVLADLALGKD
jgi:hypothetical protein